MDWMNQLSGVLQGYTGTAAAKAPTTIDNDFDEVSNSAPPSAVADGLAAAFRSDQTPDFGQMAAQLFSQSNGPQRAGIINTLIRTAGPMIAAHVLSRSGNTGGGGGLSSLIDLLKGGQQPEVTAEQAEQIPADVVGEMAAQAEKKDPSVIDHVSNFYAEHPTLVKTLGAAALAIAIGKIAEGRQGS